MAALGWMCDKSRDMGQGRQSEEDWKGSGFAAEPVRRWLTGFFRRRVDNGSDVEDLVQDVFVRIAGREGGDRVDNLGAYVLRTAVNVLADRGRRGRARRADMH